MILSLIIPVYKVERYIAECLNSIFCQLNGRNEVEIIIVNDGTPDNSMVIIDEITRDKTNVRIINQANQGLSVARNTGLQYATGEYVWFIDSDDWLLPNAINDVLTCIAKHPDVSVFSTILERHVEKQNKVEQEYFPSKLNLTGKEYLQLRYKQGASQRFIFKKSFLTGHNLSFYPGILHEDGLFGYQMLYRAERIIILETPVYAYRIRGEGSIMSSISMRTPKDMLFIHQQLIRFCKEEVAEEDKLWYRLKIFSILVDLFQFSKPLAFDLSFKRFFKENRSYFNEEIGFVLQHKRDVNKRLCREAFMLKHIPLSLMKLKYIVRKYILR